MIGRWVKRTTWVDSVEAEVVAEAEGEAVQGGSRSWHPLKGSQVGMNPSATVVVVGCPPPTLLIGQDKKDPPSLLEIWPAP